MSGSGPGEPSESASASADSDFNVNVMSSTLNSESPEELFNCYFTKEKLQHACFCQLVAFAEHMHEIYIETLKTIEPVQSKLSKLDKVMKQVTRCKKKAENIRRSYYGERKRFFASYKGQMVPVNIEILEYLPCLRDLFSEEHEKDVEVFDVVVEEHDFRKEKDKEHKQGFYYVSPTPKSTQFPKSLHFDNLEVVENMEGVNLQSASPTLSRHLQWLERDFAYALSKVKISHASSSEALRIAMIGILSDRELSIFREAFLLAVREHMALEVPLMSIYLKVTQLAVFQRQRSALNIKSWWAKILNVAPFGCTHLDIRIGPYEFGYFSDGEVKIRCSPLICTSETSLYIPIHVNRPTSVMVESLSEAVLRCFGQAPLSECNQLARQWWHSFQWQLPRYKEFCSLAVHYQFCRRYIMAGPGHNNCQDFALDSLEALGHRLHNTKFSPPLRRCIKDINGAVLPKSWGLNCFEFYDYCCGNPTKVKECLDYAATVCRYYLFGRETEDKRWVSEIRDPKEVQRFHDLRYLVIYPRFRAILTEFIWRQEPFADGPLEVWSASMPRLNNIPNGSEGQWAFTPAQWKAARLQDQPLARRFQENAKGRAPSKSKGRLSRFRRVRRNLTYHTRFAPEGDSSETKTDGSLGHDIAAVPRVVTLNGTSGTGMFEQTYELLINGLYHPDFVTQMS